MTENNVKPGIRRYLAKIGRKGGLVKSETKAKAVRQNGLRGGRPRKSASPADQPASVAEK